MTGVSSLIQQVRESLKNPNDLSLMLVGSFLFDLLIASEAMEFTADELADHLQASMEHSHVETEDDPDWHAPVVQEMLLAIYEEMRKLLWVHVNATPQARATAVFQRMNELLMEVRLMRLSEEANEPT